MKRDAKMEEETEGTKVRESISSSAPPPLEEC